MKQSSSSSEKLRDIVSYIQLFILTLVVISSMFVVVQLHLQREALSDFQSHIDEHLTSLHDDGGGGSSNSAPETRYFKDVLSFDGDPIKGDPSTSEIVIVEFGDFECSYCAQAESQVKSILKEFPNVLYIFKNYPLSYHGNAKSAAIAALCAGKQGKYWEMHQVLFDNQSNLGEEFFPQYARLATLDETEFSNCLKDQSIISAIDKTTNEAIELNISGTPSFIVGKITSRTATEIGIDGQIVYMNSLRTFLNDLK